MAGGQDEKEQTLNPLLAEMAGSDRSVAIVVLAATNRPEVPDPALMRAGGSTGRCWWTGAIGAGGSTSCASTWPS